MVPLEQVTRQYNHTGVIRAGFTEEVTPKVRHED